VSAVSEEGAVPVENVRVVRKGRAGARRFFLMKTVTLWVLFRQCDEVMGRDSGAARCFGLLSPLTTEVELPVGSVAWRPGCEGQMTCEATSLVPPVET
jgi:hypothetical protein